ncbi:MAG: TetR/AcrR family transcriptional regulator [Bizionia sp.]|nr:TetR/AcrR family transcriptional regulator [Bizionia sp.]
MITKTDILECSILNFTKFGSKHFTLDQLSKILGISKKTIYKHFENKENLVAESLGFLIDKFMVDINEIVEQNTHDGVVTIILIYKKGFEYLKYFKPSFLFGIKKYYPKANLIFKAFRQELVFTMVYAQLERAKADGHIRTEIDIKLICELYYLKMDAIAFTSDSLFDSYTLDAILEHSVVCTLKGITTLHYSNPYFE